MPPKISEEKRRTYSTEILDLQLTFLDLKVLLFPSTTETRYSPTFLTHHILNDDLRIYREKKSHLGLRFSMNFSI